MPNDKETPQLAQEGQTRGESPSQTEVQGREGKYMFATRNPLGWFPVSQGSRINNELQQVHEMLSRMPDVEVVRMISPARSSSAPAGNNTSDQDVIVAITTQQQGFHLQSTAGAGMIVEPDALVRPLTHFGPSFANQRSASLRVFGCKTELKFHVQDTSGKPVPNAQILLFSDDGSEAQNSTDSNGDATVRVPVGSVNQIAGLYVKPRNNCWERHILEPRLETEKVNLLKLRPLGEFKAAGFPNDPFLGWGQQLMGLADEAMSELTGRGVKIALIDSGCDNTHPALRHIRTGRDFLNLDRDGNPNAQSWSVDPLGHGTHCAGVIAGSGEKGQLRGFCPQSEIHVLKILPGGTFSDLISALYYCIDNQIDVVSCGVGSEERSEIVQQVLDRAREAGVAVVAAAGNSAGPVQFPGQVPSVLCVSAVGMQGRYPDDTCHAHTAQPGTVLINGLFPANFSCCGPEVRVCGPGVAVISTTPGGGYAAMDGTCLAAASIAGAAGLIVGHHSIFADKSLARNAARVDLIFRILMASAEPIGFNPFYCGAGLPKITNALRHSQVPELHVAVQEGLRAGFAALYNDRPNIRALS